MYFNLSRIILLLSIQCSFIVGCASVDATRDIDAAQSIIHERVSFDSSEELWSTDSPLSMKTAVAVAITQDALLQRDLAIIVQRRAELVQSGQLPNPTISGAFGIAVDGLSGAPLMMKGMQGLGWLWTRPDRVAAAEHTLQQAILTSAQRATTVAKNAKTSFAKVYLSKELVNLAEREVKTVHGEIDITQQLHIAGEIPKTSVDKKRIHASKSKLKLSRLQEQHENAVIELLTVMGMPTEDADFELFFLPVHFLEQQNQFDAQSLLSLAVNQRLDLSTKYAVVKQRTSTLGFANPPLITATIGFNENFGNREAMLPGVSITIPLDGEAKESAAMSMLEQAQATYTDALRNVQSEVLTTLLSFEGTIEQLHILRNEQIEPSMQLVQNAFQLLQEGETEPLALLELQHQLLTAKQLERTQLLHSYELYYQLQYVVGGTFSELPMTALQEGVTNE